MKIGYHKAMTDLGKFYADVQRCLKHERADHNGNYDGLRASRAIEKLFISYSRGLECIAEPLAEYWEQTYIQKSTNLAEEPQKTNIDWLANVLALFDGQLEPDQNFSKKDWAEINDTVNAEAEDLPLDVLSSIMSTIVERKVL